MNRQDKNITDTMGQKWEFDENVTKVFTEMLERSIPSYSRMRELIIEIAVDYIQNNYLENTFILDLGCSNGEQINDLIHYLPENMIVGCEISKPMYLTSKERFKDNPNVTILNTDISKNKLPVINCGLILSILTLQFIPIEYRQFIVQNIYDHLHKRGIFIFVEKIIGDNYDFSKLYEKLYYNMKQINGYSIEEIRDKKLKLEGVLVPGTNQFNIELLKQAGFRKVDIFWKDLNFIGYIAMK